MKLATRMSDELFLRMCHHIAHKIKARRDAYTTTAHFRWLTKSPFATRVFYHMGKNTELWQRFVRERGSR